MFISTIYNLMVAWAAMAFAFVSYICCYWLQNWLMIGSKV